MKTGLYIKLLIIQNQFFFLLLKIDERELRTVVDLEWRYKNLKKLADEILGKSA